MTVNILGTEYQIKFQNDEEVCATMGVQLGDCGGYCSAPAKEIVIANLDKCDSTQEEKEEAKRTNLRHEIVHAFLYESGLGWNSNASDCWAKNEEMVDWIAIQGPKIYKAWIDAEAVFKKKTVQEFFDDNGVSTGMFVEVDA